MRREFPVSVRRAAWSRCGGKCEACRAVLVTGNYQYDHEIPDAFGGPPTLENCKVLCTACHVAKRDWTAIAKSNRIRKKHSNPKPPGKMQSRGFDRTRRKRLDGTVVPR